MKISTPRSAGSAIKPKTYIVSFNRLRLGDPDVEVLVQANTKIEASGRAWQSKPVQKHLKGNWPQSCRAIEIESLSAV